MIKISLNNKNIYPNIKFLKRLKLKNINIKVNILNII